MGREAVGGFASVKQGRVCYVHVSAQDQPWPFYVFKGFKARKVPRQAITNHDLSTHRRVLQGNRHSTVTPIYL